MDPTTLTNQGTKRKSCEEDPHHIAKIFKTPQPDLLEVTVKVEGLEPTTWSLPRALLCEQTEYFYLILEGSQLNTVPLEISSDLDVFEYFVQWLITGRCEFRDEWKKWEHGPQLRNLAQQRALRAWFLGERMVSPGFQNFIMDKIFEFYYENSEPNCIYAHDVEYVFDIHPGHGHASTPRPWKERYSCTVGQAD